MSTRPPSSPMSMSPEDGDASAEEEDSERSRGEVSMRSRREEEEEEEEEEPEEEEEEEEERDRAAEERATTRGMPPPPPPPPVVVVVAAAWSEGDAPCRSSTSGTLNTAATPLPSAILNFLGADIATIFVLRVVSPAQRRVDSFLTEVYYFNCTIKYYVGKIQNPWILGNTKYEIHAVLVL